MVKYGDSGLAYRRQHGRHRPKRQPIMPLIDAVSVFFFLSSSPFSASSSLSQHEKEIKNKLSTDSPCFGPLSVGISKEIIWELVKIVHISEDDQDFSARRGLLEGLLLCRHLCDEMVVDEEPSKPARLVRGGCRGRTGKTQLLPKTVDWAAKKWIFDRRGKLLLGCCAIGHERKEN